MPLPTLRLFDQARSGDRRSLDQLLVVWRRPLLERIRLMMGPKAREVADSGDFLHDVLLDLARQLPAPPATDLEVLRMATTIARNNIRDAVRRKREKCVLDLARTTQRLFEPAETETPGQVAGRAEDVDRLIAAMMELAPQDREVIELRDFDKLNYREIGARMGGRSEDAAERLHARALRKLATRLVD